MLIAATASVYALRFRDERWPTRIEDSDVLEDVRRVAFRGSGRWSHGDVPACAHWDALEDDRKRGSEHENDKEDYYDQISDASRAAFVNLPKVPWRNLRHRVRSASRSRKKPMESLMKL